MAELPDDEHIYENPKDNIGGAPGQVVGGGPAAAVTDRVKEWDWKPKDADECKYFKLQSVPKIIKPTVSMLPAKKPANQPLFNFQCCEAGKYFHSLVSNHCIAKSTHFRMDNDPFQELQTEIFKLLPGDLGKSSYYHELEKSVAGYGVTGRIDCLLNYKTPPNRIIVDFKWTLKAKFPVPDPKQGLQLLLYQWLLGYEESKVADMYLIRYEEKDHVLKLFRFDPPGDCQYDPDNNTEKQFQTAIGKYMTIFDGKQREEQPQKKK